jgi:hypothetical protein
MRPDKRGSVFYFFPGPLIRKGVSIVSRASFVEALESRRLLSGTISGRLYIDLNGNGEFDYSVEPVADNFSVVAVGQSGNVQVYTSSNGEFILYGVPAGEYLVKADAREGFTPGIAGLSWSLIITDIMWGISESSRQGRRTR